MIGIAFFVCLIMTIVCLIISIRDCSDKPIWGGASIFGIIFACFLFFLYVTENDKPTAMDVYQGKTEIEVTSVNGVPIDSVVVFKEVK